MYVSDHQAISPKTAEQSDLKTHVVCFGSLSPLVSTYVRYWASQYTYHTGASDVETNLIQ